MKKNFLTNTKIKVNPGEERELVVGLAKNLGYGMPDSDAYSHDYIYFDGVNNIVLYSKNEDVALYPYVNFKLITIDQVRQYIAEQKAVEYAESVGWDEKLTMSYIIGLPCSEFDALKEISTRKKTKYIIDKYKPKEPINENIGKSADIPAMNVDPSSRTFDTGSVRDDDSDKPLVNHLTPNTRLRFGTLLRQGAIKYGKDNWRKGQPDEAALESMHRHLAKYELGDRSEDHLSAIIFNVQLIMENELKNGIKFDHYKNNLLP